MTDELLIKITETQTQAAIRWMKRALEAESILTPRRIDEDTPNFVLIWTGRQWTMGHRSEMSGDWMSSVSSRLFKPQPTWWLPMLPAPEEA